MRPPAPTLQRAADGSTIRGDRSFDVPASSFVGVSRNDIRLGRLARTGSPKKYPYRVTAGDGLQGTGGRGEVHVLYESGSAEYDDADHRVRTVHHAPVGALGG